MGGLRGSAGVSVHGKLLGALALSAACASGPEHFYALSAGPQQALASSGGRAPSVVVEPAGLPDLVDRPQLVVKGAGNSVTILEQQRWAEPLRAGIPRVVAENLSKLLGTNQVSTRDDVVRSPDCRVIIDVRRLDSQPAVEVAFEALWTVGCSAGGKRTGQSSAHERLASAEVDALVAAHGRALDGMSRDIAQAVREVAAGGTSTSSSGDQR
jgi:uncharacterized lipoprotein YmbA